MAGLFFKDKQLENYKKRFVEELLEQSARRMELDKAYIPLKLVKYECLDLPCEGVYRRKTLPLANVLRGQKIWLIGNPETGKTIFLRKLFLRIVRKEISFSKIPVYIDLVNLVGSEKSLLEHMTSIFEKHHYADPLKFIGQKLEEGKFVVLLDGLDAIPNTKLAKEALAKTNRFLLEYGKFANTVIVACRSAKYQNELSGVALAGLVGLNEKQIEEHVREKLVWPAEPDRLLAKLNENIQLKRLIRTPFGLSSICSWYQNQKELPYNRAKLYQTYAEHMLGTARGSSEQYQFTLRHKMKVLEEVAFACHCQQRVSFTGDDFFLLVPKALPPQGGTKATLEGVESLLSEILSSGLITDYGGRYRFSSLSLQEFFAAHKILITANRGIKFILSQQHNDWWSGCIGFYAGLLNNPSGVTISIKEVNEPLALKCFAESKQVYSDLFEVMQIFLRGKVLKAEENMFYFSELRQALINKADANTVHLLGETLRNSPNLGLKVRCARLLCEIGDEQSLRIIEDELSRCVDSADKRWVVSGLDGLWRGRRLFTNRYD